MRTIKLLVLSTLLAATAFVKAGPPWISIEYPANPYAQDSRDAFLYVHAFHHGTPTEYPVSGTAEGMVKGDRRTVSLEFKTTSRPGVYALTKQWPSEGTWTLVLGVTQGNGESNTAYALVELGASGQVTSVNVPTLKRNGYTMPAPIVMADIDAALRTRAGKLAAR